MLEYHNSGVPHCKSYKVVHSEQNYTGISGEPNPSVGEITQRTQVGRLDVNWTADLIGGNGSWCPMLLGLPPGIDNRTIGLHGILGNGDGILITAPARSAGVTHVPATLACTTRE